MGFTVLIVGTQFGPEEVDNLLRSKEAFWEAYSTGGVRPRGWRGHFILKEGAEGNITIPGIFTEDPTEPRATDQAKKCEIDWGAMRKRARERAKKYWEEAKRLPQYEKTNQYGILRVDTKHSFVERIAKKDCLPDVVLMDGKWISKDRNKWREWEDEFQELFEKIPDNAVLTLADCHTYL